jgi:hypothetical protein
MFNPFHFFFGLGIFAWLLSVLYIVFWIWMFIDCLQNPRLGRQAAAQCAKSAVPQNRNERRSLAPTPHPSQPANPARFNIALTNTLMSRLPAISSQPFSFCR